MLNRSASSRRRRASRSAASSPGQPAGRPSGSRSAATSPCRRASIAVSPIDGDRGEELDKGRSPRHSIIPNIALTETRDDSLEEIPRYRSPRASLVPDCALSPRNSLVPDTTRSPRHSLVPNDVRSPRNSLVPDSALSPRNSLTPEQYNRSPRNSLVPEPNRSPRHSLTPDTNLQGSRLNISEYNRSASRSPRQTVAPLELKQYNPEEGNRRHRLSLTPETSRSPRGSIVQENAPHRTSPRGSIAGEIPDQRTPRGSVGPETYRNRTACDTRSSRGSLTLTFQEPPVSERRSSADNPSHSRGRMTSPHHCRSSSKGNINGATEGTGSRRASSSVSQVSGDEQRRLCGAERKYSREMGHQGLSLSMTLTTYGSVAYQLKDAHFEANGTCDFVYKALKIVNKTVVVTVFLVCLSVLPVIMLIMGVQFLRDCPREPNIPIYMVVGGSVGSVKMGLCLWNQLHTRHIDPAAPNTTSITSRIASIALTILLLTWFGFGNFWILSIKYPDYAPSMWEPNKWCHRTLYVFALVHLCIVYSVLGILVALAIALACCQMFECQWLGPRYK
ncbi:uncharacterized protein LOC126747863 isoform X2 [Anthonomus grandis grandis]|uniref:uncharacterized protein LOC126747863 isoform X2 n=1 Tax=Anthonomus grandis grandis TaxID=2921223 RepID=UPI00216554EE|nr:uncharacterized protein LOC126747863 isoform X2 [Anthonomus grandis grandis]